MDDLESGKHEGGEQVHIIYAVFLCSEWYIELNEMQIQSLALVKPRGNSLKFCKGRLRPEIQPLTLSYTIFGRKGTHFVYLLFMIPILV